MPNVISNSEYFGESIDEDVKDLDFVFPKPHFLRSLLFTVSFIFLYLPFSVSACSSGHRQDSQSSLIRICWTLCVWSYSEVALPQLNSACFGGLVYLKNKLLIHIFLQLSSLSRGSQCWQASNLYCISTKSLLPLKNSHLKPLFSVIAAVFLSTSRLQWCLLLCIVPSFAQFLSLYLLLCCLHAFVVHSEVWSSGSLMCCTVSLWVNKDIFFINNEHGIEMRHYFCKW